MTFSSKIKKVLPAQCPVLNVHVQKGADLSQKQITDSFQLAETFFTTYFPKHQYKAFLCYSWLLYPDLQKHLPQKSNIKTFANMFHIISVRKDCTCLENIYGIRY